MKLVIPTDGKQGLTDSVAEHFGRCNTYTFLDEDGKVVEIIENTSSHMGGSGLPPELMKAHDANVLLCRGLGPRALQLCKELGIVVYVCPSNSVGDIFEKWKANKIEKASDDDVCEEHRS